MLKEKIPYKEKVGDTKSREIFNEISGGNEEVEKFN